MDSPVKPLNRSNYLNSFFLFAVVVLIIGWPFLGYIPKLLGVSISILPIIIASLLWTVSKLRSYQIILSRAQILGVMLASWTLLSYIWSVDRAETIPNSSYKAWILIFALILILGTLFRRSPSEGIVSLAYMTTGMALSLGVVYNFLQKNTYESTIRYSAFSLNPNVLGAVLVLGVPLAVSFIATSDDSKSRLLYLSGYLYLFSAVFAILLTGSRQSFVALLPPILYYIYVLKSKVNNLRYPLIFALCVLTFIFFVSPVESLVARYSSIVEEVRQFTFGSRITQWSGGVHLFTEHPLFGTGYGTFNTLIEPIIGYNVDTDSEYFGILYELGIIGFLLFTALLLNLLRLSLRSAKWFSFICSLFILMAVNDLLRIYLIWILIMIMDGESSNNSPVI